MTEGVFSGTPASEERAAGPDKEAAIRICRRLREAGYEAYLVGGCVRDLIRGVEPKDFDIVTSARPKEVQALFARTVPVGVRFGVVIVVEEGHAYEVATFRTEADYLDGRHPSRVGYGGIEEDVGRRDFTVNGLLLDPLTGRIIDLVGGRRDIELGIIRTIGGPRDRFAEDHLRMLRAVRLAAVLGYEVEPETLRAVRELAPLIRKVSAERIREEMDRILTSGAARRGMELLDDSGLLCQVLPEVAAMKGISQPPSYHPEGDVWEHTLRMLALLPGGEGDERRRLAWAVLLHDTGKALTRSEDSQGVHFYGHVREGQKIAEAVLGRLRFSKGDMDTITDLVGGHMLFMNVQEMRESRLKRFLRRPDFDLHLELHRLDCLGSHGLLQNYEFCRRKLAEYSQEELRPSPLLRGRDLMEMGYRPGPLFKEILRAVEDAQLAGEIKTKEEARLLVRERWGNLSPP